MEEDGGWTDSDSDSLWGWLDSIVGGFETLWEKISNLPTLIYNAFVDAFNFLGEKITNVWDAVKSLPDLILEGLKAIFVPDTEVIKSQFNDMVASVSESFGLINWSYEDMTNSWNEKPAEDVTGEYQIHGLGKMDLTFFNAEYLQKGVEYFRPVIRGFIVLLLLFFNYKMILGFFKQDFGFTSGQSTDKKEG